MNIQDQIKQTKAKLAELEAKLEAEIRAQPEIKKGTIVFASYAEERKKCIQIYGGPAGDGKHFCSDFECARSYIFDIVEPITLPPSKEDLHKAFCSGWDNHMRLVNRELNVCADMWVKLNFPEAI